MMNVLSITSINNRSPYVVNKYSDCGPFLFTSDSGVELAVSFVDDDLITKATSFQLVISNVNNRHSPRDKKVQNTILAIVEEFFEKNQAGLLYICETGDGMQKMRNRLFKYWFSLYGESDDYYFQPMTIYDEEENENFAALIIRYDNPKFSDIVREFTTTINLLNSKPIPGE